MDSASVSSKENDKSVPNSMVLEVRTKDRQMTEDELMHFIQISEPSNKKQKRGTLTAEEEFDQWIEDNKDRFRHNSSTRNEWKNCIFMYNFFRRRGSQNRASSYLQKIENAKTEKIRARVSKIRKLDLEYVSLPVERVNPEDAKRRKNLESKAKAESAADKMNAQRILRSILFNGQY
ncbi:hypothetical protein GCK72_014219 [Caenorhabditis remanei]|uniref:Uncharacterized protein n=1 Tax=Caenorhabditis remanei TaxID=31234 RepID=A0A6A5GTG4_CAERE|nr:hypothetical protein GCK72_014219 [Caenorhabditis remanei]KAF1757763.1 hypothetical protein GCK72_014219 [Caenorhabditis remanei]